MFKDISELVSRILKMGDFTLKKKKIQIPGVEKCSPFGSVLAAFFIVCF